MLVLEGLAHEAREAEKACGLIRRRRGSGARGVMDKRTTLQ